MEKIKIMEWNIHQQGRQYNNKKSGDGRIPLWIVEEIPDDVDVVVFTEFNCHAQNILEFYNLLSAKGFSYSTTNCSCAWSNDILVALRGKEFEVKSSSYVKAYPDIPNTTFDIDRSIIPENLRVDIHVGEADIHLWGIRIKDLNSNYKKRKIEMETVLHWIEEIGGINILVGDFNNLRVNTIEQEWNLNVLDRLLKEKQLERKTPSDNHSWGVSRFPNGEFDGYIKNDHLIHSKEVYATIEPYVWSFLERCNYSLKKSKFGIEKLVIPVGEPDHGIMIAELLIFDDKDFEAIAANFSNGRETHKLDDLLTLIENALGYDKKEGKALIDICIERGLITKCDNNKDIQRNGYISANGCDKV